MKKIFPVLTYVNIPNVLTTLGLVCGMVACYFLVQGNLQAAIVALFFAGVMDLFDGYLASLLNQQTKFGQHVDGLVDFFTCCIMPLWMVFLFLGSYPLVLAGMAFYTICGLWRLAYYNVLATEKPPQEGARKYFTGLPVPGAMMAVTISFWIIITYELPALIMAAVFLAIGLLMISGIQLPKYGLWQKVLWGAGLVFMVVMLFFA